MLLIGIAGRAGSGKDTMALVLERTLRARGITCKRLAMAAPLRRMLEAGFGISYEDCPKNDPNPKLAGVSTRRAMQTLGTEWGREVFGLDVWVNLAIRDLDDADVAVGIITDVRFANEARRIREEGGRIIKMLPWVEGEPLAHASEQEVDAIVGNWTVPGDRDDDQRDKRVVAALVTEYIEGCLRA